MIDEEGVVVALTTLADLVQVGTDLEVVRPGDVGHREPFVHTLVIQHLVERAPRSASEVQPVSVTEMASYPTPGIRAWLR